MKMSIYKRSILLLSLLMVSVSLHAATESEAQFKRINKEYTLNRDGGYTLRVVKEVTLFTHASFNKIYGETFIVYNPERESVKINKSYTTQADGTTIETPQNAFNEVLPSFAANAPAYNHIKELVVTHTGLEIGATIYLDYTITSKIAEGGRTPIDIVEIIEERSPVDLYTVSFSGAGVKSLNYSIRNSEVAPEVTKRAVTYTFENLPAASYDGFKPENGTSPTIVATTAPSSFVAEILAAEASCSSQEFSDLVAAVSSFESCDESVAEALNYINKRLASSALPFIYQNNEARPIETILRSGYATSMERSMLMSALLTGAEIPHTMLLLYPKDLSADMLTLSTLKKVLFKIGDKYYSAQSTNPIDVSKRREFDNLFAVGGNGELTQVDFPAQEPQFNRFEDRITADMASSAGYINYTLKGVNSGVRGWRMSSLPTSRTTPVELAGKVDEKNIWTLEMEDGVELATKPFEKSLEYPCGTLHLKLTKEGNSVTFEQSISFTSQRVSVADYAQFREMMNLWSGNAATKLLFRVE